jgi:hypothetical protein
MKCTNSETQKSEQVLKERSRIIPKATGKERNFDGQQLSVTSVPRRSADSQVIQLRFWLGNAKLIELNLIILLGPNDA